MRVLEISELQLVGGAAVVNPAACLSEIRTGMAEGLAIGGLIGALGGAPGALIGGALGSLVAGAYVASNNKNCAQVSADGDG